MSSVGASSRSHLYRLWVVSTRRAPLPFHLRDWIPKTGFTGVFEVIMLSGRAAECFPLTPFWLKYVLRSRFVLVWLTLSSWPAAQGWLPVPSHSCLLHDLRLALTAGSRHEFCSFRSFGSSLPCSYFVHFLHKCVHIDDHHDDLSTLVDWRPVNTD